MEETEEVRRGREKLGKSEVDLMLGAVHQPPQQGIQY